MTYNDTRNEDWLRTRTWDLYNGATLVTTLAELLYCLGVDQASVGEQRSVVKHLTELPSWEPAPPSLKSEVEGFIGSGMAPGPDPYEGKVWMGRPRSKDIVDSSPEGGPPLGFAPLQREVSVCSACKGTGIRDGDKPCSKCNGTGIDESKEAKADPAIVNRETRITEEEQAELDRLHKPRRNVSGTPGLTVVDDSDGRDDPVST